MNLEKLQDQARALIDENQQIEAIRLVRETTGWGLKESKDYVDALVRAALPTLSPADEAALEQKVKALVQRDEYVDAIKHVRVQTGWDLGNSKAYVDSLTKGGTTGNWVSVASHATDLLDQGMKDKAVEWVTAQAKLDTQEAQDYVDFVLAARSTRSSPDDLEIPAPVVAQVRDLLAQDHKVEAVKLVRILTNWGLRDSKDYIDSVEQTETTVDYTTFSANELLAALELAGRAPDLELVRACLDRREDLTPGLLTMLAKGPDSAWDDEDPRHFRDIHAGLLLCAFRELAALPTFGQVFRDEAREYMLEWFDQDLPVAYGPSAIPMLTELMNDTSTYDYPRYSAMGMLAIIAHNHPEEQETIVGALRAMLPPLTDDGALPPDTEYSELWTWIAYSLLELRDTDSQPQVVALYRASMIDEWVIGNEQEYLASFQQAIRKPPRTYDVLDTYKGLHREAEEEARWEAGAAKRAAQEAQRKAEAARRAEEKQARGEKQVRRRAGRATATPRPATHTQQKVGRNAPCTCGSGRKYKHCCGKR